MLTSIKQMYLQGPNVYFKISIAFLVLIGISLVYFLVLSSVGEFTNSQEYYVMADNSLTYATFPLAVLANTFMSIGAIKLMQSWQKKS